MKTPRVSFRSLLLVAFLGSWCASSATAQGLPSGVDVVGAGDDLQAAIDAAAPGDVLLIRDGAEKEEEVILEGKGLTLVGDQGIRPIVAGRLIVRDVPAGQTVVLRDLTLGPYWQPNPLLACSPMAPASLEVRDCQGTVWIEDCEVAQHPGLAALLAVVPAQDAALAVHDSASVVVVRSMLGGGGTSFACTFSGPSVPRAALKTANASVQLFESTFTGMRGEAAPGFEQVGGDGARTLDSFVYASDCTFAGGDGFLGSGWVDAGNGFVVLGTSDVKALGCTFEAGMTGGSAQPGEPLVGTVDILSGSVRTYALDPGLVSGSAAVTATGIPGDLVVTIVGGEPFGVWLPLHLGVQLPAAPLQFVIEGTIPASGVLTKLLPLDPAPAPFATLYRQGFFFEPGGDAFLGSGSAVVTIGGPPVLSVSNTGFAANAVLPDAREVLLGVGEADQGADLNGDGDQSDSVAHLWDRGTGLVANLGYEASGIFDFAGGIVVSRMHESFFGVDLSGDGDAFDLVYSFRDARTGALGRSEALPFISFIGQFGSSLHFDGTTLAALVDEAQGAGDLNKDGDAVDVVAQVLFLNEKSRLGPGPGLNALSTTAFFATGCCIDFFFSLSAGEIVASENFLAFGVDEAAQGNGDLNGDGDVLDTRVIRLLDKRNGGSFNTGLVGVFDVTSSFLFVYVDEYLQGTDGNGDGDFDDQVLHLVDPLTRAITNLGLASSEAYEAAGRVVLIVDEADQNADLNGDGDQDDSVPHVFDPETALVTNTGVGMDFPGRQVGGKAFLFAILEETVDLNGDGKLGDHVVHTLDVETGVLTNHAVATRYGAVSPGSERLLTVTVWEGAQRVDLNGDGDRLDHVASVYDVETGRFVSTGLASVTRGPDVFGRRAVFGVLESSQGNTDFNGDGDTLDIVPFVYDADTETTTSVGVAGFVAGFLDETAFALRVVESQQGADLNGDGDQADVVLFVVEWPLF